MDVSPSRKSFNPTPEQQKEIDSAFPPLDPGAVPCGSRILLQLRSPKTKTPGGIILTDDTQETEKWNTQVAKVIDMGPLAFKNRDKGTVWSEGEWVERGDYVRCLKYGGDRWEVEGPNGEKALFILINDLEIMARVYSNPLTVKAFI